MMNPGNMMKAMQAWGTFTNNHPKFPAFLQAMKVQGIKEGTIIEVSVTDPDGKKIETNIKVKAEDMELFNSLKDMN